MAAIKYSLPTDDGIVKARLIVRKDKTGQPGLMVNAKGNFVDDDTLYELIDDIYKQTGHKLYWARVLELVDKESQRTEIINEVHVVDDSESENQDIEEHDFALGKMIFGKKIDFKNFSKKQFSTIVDAERMPGKEGVIFAQYYDGDPSTRNSKKGQLLRSVKDMLFLDEAGNPFSFEKFGTDSWGNYGGVANFDKKFTEGVPEEGYQFSNEAFTNLKDLQRWSWVAMVGTYVIPDSGGQYKNKPHFEARAMINLEDKTIMDNTTENSRYELGAHTKLSQQEAVANSDDLFDQAAKLGIQGVALTDSSSVQSYEVAMQYQGRYKYFRPLYGVQLNEVPERPIFVWNANDIPLQDPKTTFVAFDMETTGLSAIHDQIIQLSAVRFTKEYKEHEVGRGKNKRTETYLDVKIIDKFDTFVNPGPNEDISQRITDITGIHDEDVRNAPNRTQAISDFLDFVNEYDNTVLVGQNVVFDMRFLNQKLKEDGKPELTHEIFDTLTIAHRVIKKSRGYNLTALSKKLGIKLDQAHNSLYDAEATGRVFFRLLEVAHKGDIKDPNDLESDKNILPIWDDITNGLVIQSYEHSDDAYKETGRHQVQHLSVLAKDQAGIKDIYELISLAHIKHFHFEPRLYLSEIKDRLENGHHILLGSGDSASTLYDLTTRYGYDIALDYAKEANFDYVEISLPSTVGMNFTENPMLIDVYRQYFDDTIKIAREINALPVVTGDVHYVTKKDKTVQEILVGHDFNEDQHLKSTEEIFEELKLFANDELLQEIVVDNTIKIAKQCKVEEMEPIHEKLTPPRMDGADEELRETSYERAHELYGEELDQIIVDRIEKELKSVIGNGYAVVYLTAKRIVDWSVNEKDYLVGSRGSVGGSFVAYLVGITEVNPLPPHYRGVHGDYLEFVDPKEWQDGWDLPKKDDPNHPGEALIGDGHGASFEVFAGVSGKKVPDIDLNIASDIQAEAQQQMKKIFGEEHVFRVGNISTISDGLAWNKTNTFDKENDEHFSEAEKEYYKERLVGVKNTTGQHAAGIVVIPQDMDVTDFTPYVWPANDDGAGWMTTHFNKDMIHDSLLKMDLLGHQDEVVFHYLEGLTGVDPKDINPYDFSEVIANVYKNHVTVRGMPEIGADFSARMIDEIKPKKFSELVQIMGLSHGTDVWTGNAQDLINSGTATISEVIGSRDKILNDTMARGYSLEQAHELVQIIKRHELRIPEDKLQELREMGMPEWYLDSMKKVGYLFPIAHAIAYALSAVRMGWYKYHYPNEFYTAWFNHHGHSFDVDTLITNDPMKFYERREQALLEDDRELANVLRTAMDALGYNNEYFKASVNLKNALGTSSSDEKKNLVKKRKQAKQYQEDAQALSNGLRFRDVDKDKSEAFEWHLDPETHELFAPITEVVMNVERTEYNQDTEEDEVIVENDCKVGGAVAIPYTEFREEFGRAPFDADELKTWQKTRIPKGKRFSIPRKADLLLNAKGLYANRYDYEENEAS